MGEKALLMEAFKVNSMGEGCCTEFNVLIHSNGVVLKTGLNQEAKQISILVFLFGT